MKAEIPVWEKIAVTMDEAIMLTSASREEMEKWAMDHDFPSFRIGARGGKRLIDVGLLKKYIANRAMQRIGERRLVR